MNKILTALTASRSSADYQKQQQVYDFQLVMLIKKKLKLKFDIIWPFDFFNLTINFYKVESVRRCQKELVSQLMAIVQSGCKPNSTNDGTNNGSSTNTPNGSAKPSGSDHSIFSQCGPV